MLVLVEADALIDCEVDKLELIEELILCKALALVEVERLVLADWLCEAEVPVDAEAGVLERLPIKLLSLLNV